VEIPGVDEAGQLSLSNPMAVNRGAADHARAVSIIEEYRRRRERGGAFAEWYSIDPPFPGGVFGDERLVKGAYVNGGIMPLVGGELARAAFDHGFEAYGVDILRRYSRLVSEKGESYLWYFPDGTPADRETSTSPDAEPCDAWGSSAMLYALVEGLAGVVDLGRCYDRVSLSPRWPAAGVASAEVQAAYPASGAELAYRYRSGGGRIRLDVRTDEAEVAFHVLLPEGTAPRRVTIDDRDTGFVTGTVEQSRYADFAFHVRHAARVEIELE
jgi:hypothetical protein